MSCKKCVVPEKCSPHLTRVIGKSQERGSGLNPLSINIHIQLREFETKHQSISPLVIINSHNLFSRLCFDIVRRRVILVTLIGLKGLMAKIL